MIYQGPYNTVPAVKAANMVYLPDTLRRSVEASSGGRMTVIYTAKGQPSYMYIQPRFMLEDIAPGLELGTGTHPAFLFNGVADQEIFIGAYPATIIDGEALSLPQMDPAKYINFDNARATCKANGPGWDMMSNLDWAAISLWCMANGYQPKGNTNFGRYHDNHIQTARRVDALAPGSYGGTGRTLSGSGPNTWAHDNSASGIHDLVGNVKEWQTGVQLLDGRAWIAPDNGGLEEIDLIDSLFDFPTSRIWSTVDATGAGDLLKQSLLVPASAGLSPVGYMYTNLTGERTPCRGGSGVDAGNAGLAAMDLTYSRTSPGTFIGFRPRFRNV